MDVVTKNGCELQTIRKSNVERPMIKRIAKTAV